MPLLKEKINWKLVRLAALVTGFVGKRVTSAEADEAVNLLKALSTDLKINKTAIKRERLWFTAYNEEKGITITSNNQNKFAKNHALDQRNISSCLRGTHKTHKGWVFRWK